MITLVRTVQTSCACPAQWDAWDAEGNYYYLRFRNGVGTVQNLDRAGPDYTSSVVARFVDDDPWNGHIELEDFAARAGIALAPKLEQVGFTEYFHEVVAAAHAEVSEEGAEQ